VKKEEDKTLLHSSL